MVSLDFDASGAQFQAVAETEWIPALGVAWRVGVDGIALALALMTALLFLAAVAWPAETQGRARQYYAWFLFLQGASLGDRKSVMLGKSVYVPVNHGGGRL